MDTHPFQWSRLPHGTRRGTDHESTCVAGVARSVRPPPVLVLPVHVLLVFATAILSREIIMSKRLRTIGRTVTKTVGMPVGALKARRDHKR